MVLYNAITFVISVSIYLSVVYLGGEITVFFLNRTTIYILLSTIVSLIFHRMLKIFIETVKYIIDSSL